RGGRKGGEGRGGSQGGGSQGGRGRDNRYRAEIKKFHDKLERYYNELIELSEDERKEFWEALRRELPNSFRFCGSKGHALTVKRLLEERYIPEITQLENYDGNPVTPPVPVPWYPDNLAWWMTTPKNVVRRYPPFAKFQKFLVSETSVGNISRQEVVSMIPPLLLDVRPGHVVLDLCAAPGSKAAQLLEMIHSGEEGRIQKALHLHAADDGRDPPEYPGLNDVDMAVDAGDDGRATGMLIANDMDYKRSHLLIHQLKRLSSPNMIVTNHDATLFPSLKLPSDDPKRQNYLKFDRILADVPCSGDGTLRKNVNMWKDWIPGNALGLHQTQVRILVRALQMLKPGGRVVYSTCSMNPVENESVIAAAVERCGHENVELLDCSNELPGLARKPGLKTWKVMDKAGRIWNSWKEVESWVAEQKDKVIPGKLVPTMFAQPPAEGAPEVPLERCLRVYAHQQDTGGFFIVALHKKKEFKAKPENWGYTRPGAEEQKVETSAENTPKAEEEPSSVPEAVATARTLEAEDQETPAKRLHTETAAPPTTTTNGDAVATEDDQKKTADAADQAKPQTASDGYGDKAAKKLNKEPFEEPFKYLAADHEVIKNVLEFYQVSPRFPADRFMVRNAKGEPSKAVYYTSALVRDVLSSNEGRSCKFVHGGVKMFMKQDAPSAEVCRWRIQSEGMPILQGYVGKERIVVLRNKQTLHRLLIEMFPRINNEEWKKLDEIGERVREIGLGCLVLRIEPDGTDPDFSERMALPLWKSFHSLNLMLPKEDRSAMLLRIYNDTTPLVNTMLKDQKKPAADAEIDTQDEEAIADAASVGDAAVEAPADVEMGDASNADETAAAAEPTEEAQEEATAA
ncbi:S-adenosyl-L-methionine-dependent methyltransferase, partial [Coniella lustricola]